MSTKYLTMEDYDAYQSSFDLSNFVWNIISRWDSFEKNTLGKQYVRAIDSISANIAEGYGRFSKKDKIRFYYYSLASVLECKDWNNKCYQRSLIKKADYEYIQTRLDQLPKDINQLIQYTNQKLKY
jgi:four helix bundle protein